MARFLKLPLPIPILLGLAAGGYLLYHQPRTITIPVTPEAPATEAPHPAPTPAPATVTIPAAYTIKNVPFTPQAPFANWDAIHEEACEEASVLMARRYFAGERSGLIDPTAADKEIADIMAWEQEKFGTYKDTTARQTAQILTEKYGRKARLTTTVTVNAIKEETSQGHLIIVPAAGRLLPNPYFTAPGPIYHNLVIIGYTASQFITNDPGTRHGLGFRYTYSGLLNAVHDWTGNPDTMTSGRKVMIVVEG